MPKQRTWKTLKTHVQDFSWALGIVRIGHAGVPFVQQAPSIELLVKRAALNVEAFCRQCAIASTRAERFQHMLLFRFFETLGRGGRRRLSTAEAQDLPNFCSSQGPRR